MKLYIASRFRNKTFIRDFIATLPPDCEVVSTWHNLDNSADGTRLGAVERDLREIDLCDAVLAVTQDCEAVPGGIHFEAGYAHGKGKRVFLLGPAVNIFYDIATPWAVTR